MSAPDLNAALRAIALASACMLLAACKPASAETAAGAPKASSPAQASTRPDGAAARAPLPEPRAAAEPVASAETGVAGPGSPPTNGARALPFADRLLAEKPLGSRTASDFVLGPLSPQADPQGPDQAAHGFLRDLLDGKLDPARLEAEYAPVFQALYADALDKLPPGLTWRLARGSGGSDGARIYALALVGPESRAEGSLRLYPEAGSWSIASLDLDLASLARPRAERESAFDPDRFDWPE